MCLKAPVNREDDGDTVTTTVTSTTTVTAAGSTTTGSSKSDESYDSSFPSSLSSNLPNTFKKKPTSCTTIDDTMMLSATLSPPPRPEAPSPWSTAEIPLMEPSFSCSYSPPPSSSNSSSPFDLKPPQALLAALPSLHKPIARRPSIETASTNSATTSSSLNAPQGNCSVVRFTPSPPVIHNYEMGYDPQQDRSKLWYTKSDIHDLQEQDKVCVKTYQEQEKYVTSLLKIWSTPIEQPEVLSRLVRPIQDTPLRGLEKHSLKAMKARRGVVLKKVLQAQKELRFCVADPQERARLLKEECQPLSRTSARFARAMALGDHAATTTTSTTTSTTVALPT